MNTAKVMKEDHDAAEMAADMVALSGMVGAPPGAGRPLPGAAPQTSGDQLLEVARRTGLRSYLHGVNAVDARALLTAFVNALPPACSRVSWMDAQGDLTIEETFLIPGVQRVVELLDAEGDVIGRGDTLMAALDDAMGVRHG